jgi:nucleoid-associated protein YgaU
MPRPKLEDISSAGQDSFLDVVTNIVGILIILVMVVGGRVQQIVLTATPQAKAKAAELERELEELDQSAVLIESEVADLAEQARTVATAAAFAGEARITLATTVAAAKVEVEKRKQSADKDRVSAAEEAARRKQLEAEIERCTLEADGLSHAPATMKEVLAYPTPIARTVTGEELHFQIDQGRIAYIPLVELFELAKTQTRRHSGSLTSMAQRIETVGPVQDFSLDYVIEVKVDQARGQVLVRSREWVVRPASPGLGETIAEALQPHSKFRRVIADVRPDTTITLWCYPDSFEEFRGLREELHRLGIPTAGRPMPEGAPIGGSTDGSKSVVQ